MTASASSMRSHPADVVPDPRPRGLFLDRWRRGDHSCAAGLRRRSAGVQPSSSRAAAKGSRSRRRISLGDNRVTVRYALRAQAAGRFETELNLAMPSCDGVLGRYVFEGGIPGGFGQPLSLPSMTTLSLEDGVLGGMVGAAVQSAGRAGRRPAPYRVAVRGRLREDHAGGHAAARLAGGGGRQRHHRRARGAQGLARLSPPRTRRRISLCRPVAALATASGDTNSERCDARRRGPCAMRLGGAGSRCPVACWRR